MEVRTLSSRSVVILFVFGGEGVEGILTSFRVFGSRSSHAECLGGKYSSFPCC